ncbi:MAG TPA: DKNYY domain-containing protein, partial [Anaeromyxobacteraceae bacterium]|nr:DKNYY domain-containing protein [Anaeromyxobacteraceae bacterium]
DVAVYHLRGGRERVAHADAATFRPLNETFARDLDRAFAEIRLIPGADVASFEALSPAFARDAKRVYRYDEPVEGADPATFVPLDEDWGRDARFVYRRTLRFPKCDPGTFHRVGEHLYADRATVYFDEMPGATGDFFVKRIPGVDFATFVQLNGTYARDARRVYVDGAELPGADAATFSVVGLFAARDVHRCYAMEHPLPCSDAVVLPRDYPSSHTKMGPDDLLLAETRGPLLHGREKVSIDPDWTVGYESDGFLVVPRGDYEVPIRCEEGEGNFSRGTFEPARGLESGRLYMLERGRNPGCVAEASGVAMVRGSIDGPPVWLRMDGKPSVQKVFPAGRHTLTAVCRRVTR